MRLVHFSHRGHKRFGVLLSDDRVLDLTHFFPNERVLRSAGEEGLRTVREAVGRAQLRRSVGGHLYSLSDVVLEHPDPGEEDILPAIMDKGEVFRAEFWGQQVGTLALRGGFGVHVVRKIRQRRR